jgi:IclR family KDG regulon transcriptional repressor
MARSRTTTIDSDSSYRVQVLERAIDVLELFSVHRRELSIQEIVDLTGLNRSTVRRLVAILRRRGLLQEDPATRKYRLGVWLFKMGGLVLSSFSLRQAASQALWDLKNRLKGTILLSVKNEDRFVVVDRWESVVMVSMPTQIGMSRPITYGPLGRVFMSNMDEARIAELLLKWPLEACTPYSVTDIDQFQRELARTAELGYALDIEEVAEGIMGIAAPIMNFAGDIVAALCVGLPATRQGDAEYVNAAIGHLKGACAEISGSLGYQSGEGDDPSEEEKPVK